MPTTTNVSEPTRRERRTTIIIPPDVFVISKTVTIKHQNGSTTTVSSNIISLNVTGMSIRDGTSQCTIVLDNTDGRYINADKTDFVFTGGETMTVSFDYASGTTRQFKGKCNAPKAEFSKNGHTLIITARTVPEAADRRVVFQVDGTAQAAVKSLIDTYLSTVMSYSNFNTNLGTNAATLKASYSGSVLSIIKDIFARMGWDGYIEFDANDDDTYDLNGWIEGTQHNSNLAIGFSQNLISVSNWGEDSDLESNTIHVVGKNTGGAPIIRTERDTVHIARFWRKDIEINDNAVVNDGEADQRAIAELQERIEDEKNGTIQAIGDPDIVPGQTIEVQSPHDLIGGKYVVRRYVHNLSISGWVMNIDIVKRQFRQADLFKERIKVEEDLASFDNPNGMEQSINMDFDSTSDDGNFITSKSNITVAASKIQISSGTQGIVTSKVRILPSNVTTWDMVLKNAEQFEISTIQASNDGGIEYVTATSNQQKTSFNFTSTGNKLRVKITLNADGSKNQFPSIDGVVVRAK